MLINASIVQEAIYPLAEYHSDVLCNQAEFVELVELAQLKELNKRLYAFLHIFLLIICISGSDSVFEIKALIIIT